MRFRFCQNDGNARMSIHRHRFGLDPELSCSLNTQLLATKCRLREIEATQFMQVRQEFEANLRWSEASRKTAELMQSRRQLGIALASKEQSSNLGRYERGAYCVARWHTPDASHERRNALSLQRTGRLQRTELGISLSLTATFASGSSSIATCVHTARHSTATRSLSKR